MAATKFTEKILIEETAEFVFDFTQDYTKRLSWDTFLRKAELLDGVLSAAKGVKANCIAKNGMGMITEYVTFNRPKVTAIKMVDGPYLFKSFLGSWTFTEVHENKTEVSFVYSFSLRFPLSLITGLVKGNLRRNVRQRLIDLKRNIEN
ncbi:SRPBCC family protein [Pedobacter frigoris]|uniref:type II toxin-antitoxin system RatA family toxin n=1 Tax=Pedobacter frigoris TaxID=2571272 RepID=UPI00292E40BD|nr:SRPBCC family protein [Pedobacter frigoris]